jgi:predicted hotdog family 3-hydroxylacyl-ACP dehydratase
MDAENRVIEGQELLSLLPHRGKIVLLSRITAWDMEKFTLSSEYDVAGDCIFYDPLLKGIPSWAGFECMAQSISALSGLAGRERGEKPKIGFILSVSNMELSAPVLKAGTTIRIRVEEEAKANLVFTFRGEIFSGERRIITAKLTVMETAGVVPKFGGPWGS